MASDKMPKSTQSRKRKIMKCANGVPNGIMILIKPRNPHPTQEMSKKTPHFQFEPKNSTPALFSKSKIKQIPTPRIKRAYG
jgi:hypothetical protein